MSDEVARASPGNGNRLIIIAGLIIVGAAAIVLFWLQDINGSVRDLRENAARFSGILEARDTYQREALERYSVEIERQDSENALLWTAIRRVESAQARFPLDEFLRRFHALETTIRGMQEDIGDLRTQTGRIAALLEKEHGEKGGNRGVNP